MKTENKRRRLSASARRATILEAAARLFSEKGFGQTTTRQIAGQAGICEAVLYEHFASKQSLYAEVLVKAFEHIESRLRQNVNTGAEPDGLPDFLHSMANTIRLWFQQEADLIRLLLVGAMRDQGRSRAFLSALHVRLANTVSHLLAERGVRVQENESLDGFAETFVCAIAHRALLESVLGLEMDPEPDIQIARIINVLVERCEA